ncbi:Glypican-1, partial [Camelus dromedarius]
MYRQWWRVGRREHLRICPQGYTCCTSEMEENLANRSRPSTGGCPPGQWPRLQTTLATQLRGFDDHFQRLLNDSERALQEAFPGVFGELYTQNARAFRDLCTRSCCARRLLDCLGKQAEALRPFGEAPRELRLRAARAFAALAPRCPWAWKCSRAVMKLVYCAHCLGVPVARPCPDYCQRTQGLPANQADLEAEWRNLL